MAKRAPRDLLQEPAAAAAHREARHLSRKLDKAVARLSDRRDKEALHDARVASRRLRGWLRAFPSYIPLKRKQRHALRELAHLTNGARDAEICLAWLKRLHPRVRSPAHTEPFASVMALRDAEYARVRKTLPRHWHKLSRELRPLIHKTRESGPPLLSADFSTALRLYLRELETTRERARRRPLPPQIHRLRIAAKKVRYLLEAVLPPRRRSETGISGLRALHDSAGAIQDLQRVLALLQKVVTDRGYHGHRKLFRLYADPGTHLRDLPSASPSEELSSLLWMGRAAGTAQAELLRRLRREHLGARRPAYLRELRRFADGLDEA